MKYYYQVEGKIRNNIGDVLQGMVAKPFLPAGAEVADRENLAGLQKNEPGLLLANGWYLHYFDKFPPPENITPVYVSVHMAQSALLLDDNVRTHFKKHSPIGCRDYKTLKLFLGWGIPAYYSGCLTITAAPCKPAADAPKGEILLVDNVDHPVPEEVKNKLEELLGAKFTRISHDPPDTSGTITEYDNVSEKHMEGLLSRYCGAKLVVTTKIHCALPSLGMGANVLVIHPNPSDPRLYTVSEFVDILSYKQILELRELKIPPVKATVLNARKKLISEIAVKSVKAGYNIVARPDTVGLRLLKTRSIIMAKLYNAALKLMYISGRNRDDINRVYGGKI